MKYYSEITRQVYDSEAELNDAEQSAKVAADKEAEKKKARAARAKEVEDAYKNSLAAQRRYAELRNKFVDDYGSFHMSVTEKADLSNFDTLVDLLFGLWL